LARFDTNYHYIVPEFSATTRFSLDVSRLAAELEEARALGVRAKPVIIGPVTYLWLGKAKDGSDRLALLSELLPVYVQLLEELAALGATWVQIDEPALVTELPAAWQDAYATAYQALNTGKVKLLLTTYFGELRQNLALAARLPVQGLHLDAVNARQEIEPLMAAMRADQVLSLGVIQGRNVWKSELGALLDWLLPIHARLGERLWLAPSCSLLHVPVDLDSESPNIPTQAEIVALMRKAAERIPAERLWVNPDCGLKTRSWAEVIPALQNMVAAARTLREASARL